jgi:hypothetical protein
LKRNYMWGVREQKRLNTAVLYRVTRRRSHNLPSHIMPALPQLLRHIRGNSVKDSRACTSTLPVPVRQLFPCLYVNTSRACTSTLPVPVRQHFPCLYVNTSRACTSTLHQLQMRRTKPSHATNGIFLGPLSLRDVCLCYIQVIGDGWDRTRSLLHV